MIDSPMSGPQAGVDVGSGDAPPMRQSNGREAAVMGGNAVHLTPSDAAGQWRRQGGLLEEAATLSGEASALFSRSAQEMQGVLAEGNPLLGATWSRAGRAGLLRARCLLRLGPLRGKRQVKHHDCGGGVGGYREGPSETPDVAQYDGETIFLVICSDLI